MTRCTLRFYEELNFFLKRHQRKKDISSASYTTRTVKDLIESYGVPHVEVDLILVNGEPVSFDYRIHDNDRISVYPVFERLDIASVTRLRPEPLRHPKFIADVHLKTLARRLRMLGFDTVYDRTLEDSDLAALSAAESRILLTRDTRLLMRNEVTRGLYVRTTDPDLQAKEIADRLDLASKAKPFSRCIRCNGTIQKLDIPYESADSITEPPGASQAGATDTGLTAGQDDIMAAVLAAVPQGVREWCRDYFRCDTCGNIYWKGSHYNRMIAMVRDALSRTT